MYDNVHTKIIPSKFLVCNPKNHEVIHPSSLCFSLKVDYFLTDSVVFVCL